ncbi:fimbrial protein StdA [Salmonella enterica]|nr:fimbrial protein [Salmonella enterica subsp. diarizonae]EJM3432081.1 fimbrial protein StdA [Salmonella enterica]
MRNKILLAMAAAGMMCSASAFALDGPATPSTGPFGSGKVTFTGNITNSPCDIAPGDDDLTVKFGQISYRHLKSEHAIDTADAKSFTINLQNCVFDTNNGSDKDTHPNLMSLVSVTFTGTPGTDNKTFGNTGSGGATGVALQLLDSAHNVIVPGATSTAQQLVTGSNPLTFFAQLVNLGAADTVTPGNINVPVNYTLTYK